MISFQRFIDAKYNGEVNQTGNTSFCSQLADKALRTFFTVTPRNLQLPSASHTESDEVSQFQRQQQGS